MQFLIARALVVGRYGREWACKGCRSFLW